MAGTGFKLSLSSAKTKSNIKPGSGGLNPPPAKRARLSALGDDEPEDDNGGKHEISGWDATAGGAVKLNGKTNKEEEDEKAKQVRVIAALPNRNWREDALRKLRAGNGKGRGDEDKELDDLEKPKLSNGLHVFAKKGEEGEGASAEPMAVDSTTAQDAPKDESTSATTTTLTAEQRLEKDALAALLTGENPDHTVIPISRTEREAFEQDYREAPAAPTLTDYEATPIEGFGAALLRGMGWKDGEELGHNSTTTTTTNKDGSSNKNKKLAPPPKEIKARPALLGIGAKPEAAVGLDALDGGAKGKSAARQARDALNKPTALGVTLRNKKTGEYITEEELKKKLEMQKMVDLEGGGDSESSRRNKYARADDGDDGDEYQRVKRRDRDRDERRRDDRHDSDRDRDRRRDKDHERDRDRDRDRHSSHHHRSSRRYDDDDDDNNNGDKDDYDDRERRRDRDRDRKRDDREKEREYESSSRRKEYSYSSSSTRRDERDRDNKDRERRRRRDDGDRETRRSGRRENSGDRDRDRDRDRKRRRE